MTKWRGNIMKNRISCVALCVAGMFAVNGAALAEKPAWAGGGKPGKKDERMEERHDDRRAAGDSHFNDDTRRIIGDYYGKQARAGKCPPGLAKKNNGCLPPGQAKKWQVGRPLPREVIYYDVPPPLVVKIGPPPAGHRYVRVAGDILLIAIGTGMVIDAIQDLGRQ